jgi:hypothetical protein
MTLQEVKLRKHRSTTTRELPYAKSFDAGPLEYKIGCVIVRGGSSKSRGDGVVQYKKQTSRALSKFCDSRAYKESSHQATAFWCCLLGVALFSSASVVSIPKGVPLSREDSSLQVIFAIHEDHRRSLVSVKKAPSIFYIDQDELDPNYGGIERSNDYETYRSQFLDAIDKEEIIEKKYLNDEDREDEERACRGPKWNSYIFPNCNSVHEHTIERVIGSGKEQDYNVTYLR